MTRRIYCRIYRWVTTFIWFPDFIELVMGTGLTGLLPAPPSLPPTSCMNSTSYMPYSGYPAQSVLLATTSLLPKSMAPARPAQSRATVTLPRSAAGWVPIRCTHLFTHLHLLQLLPSTTLGVMAMPTQEH